MSVSYLSCKRLLQWIIGTALLSKQICTCVGFLKKYNTDCIILRTRNTYNDVSNNLLKLTITI